MGKDFTKDHTKAIKGLAIIVVCFSHLFYSTDIIGSLGVKFIFFDMEQIVNFTRNSGKISIAVFIFLTAYGMTCKYNKEVKSKQDMLSVTAHQYIGLLVSFMFVFLLANIACSFTAAYKPWQVYGMNGMGVFNFLIDGMGLEIYWGGITLNPTWWYMGVITMIVFLLPILWKTYKIFGPILIPFALFLPKFMGMLEYLGSDGVYAEPNSFSWYFFTIVLGIFAAENNIFPRIAKFKILSSAEGSRVIKIIISGGLLFLLSYCRIYGGKVAIVDGISTLFLCYLMYDFVSLIPIVNDILKFLGKHSMNIFLTHTFVFSIIFQDFIYSFKWGALILVVLIISTLLISCIIEKLAVLCRLEKLKNLLNCKVDKLIENIK